MVPACGLDMTNGESGVFVSSDEGSSFFVSNWSGTTAAAGFESLSCVSDGFGSLFSVAGKPRRGGVFGRDSASFLASTAAEQQQEEEEALSRWTLVFPWHDDFHSFQSFLGPRLHAVWATTMEVFREWPEAYPSRVHPSLVLHVRGFAWKRHLGLMSSPPPLFWENWKCLIQQRDPCRPHYFYCLHSRVP